MSDDLANRLRAIPINYDIARGVLSDVRQAAERIEALESEVRELALQVVASDGQAAENLDRALKAEAEVARLQDLANRAVDGWEGAMEGWGQEITRRLARDSPDG